MSRLMGKRVRIGKYAVPALLLIALTVGTVAAAVYVILQWTMTLPVLAHPRVHFYNWDDETTANTMDIEMNIFPNVTTINENATWAIRSNGTGNIYIRVSDMNTTAVAEVRIIARNDTTLFNLTWDDATPTWSDPFYTVGTIAEPEFYSLWIEVEAADTATPGTTTSITVDLKVEEP